MIRALVLLLALAGPVAGEEVVAGLSQSRVAITATFTGSRILIFGAVKRQEPIPKGVPLQVIVTVEGPSAPVLVRQKERVFGIWINRDQVEVDRAPGFYAVATSAPFAEAMSATEDLRHAVSIPRAIRSVGAPGDIADAAQFTEALIRLRTAAGLYQTNEGAVSVDEETLFRTEIVMPANLTEGIYTTRIFLTRGGQVRDVLTTGIDVRKVGLERWLFRLAMREPVIYGMLSLSMAIVAGWAASAVFRLIRA